MNRMTIAIIILTVACRVWGADYYVSSTRAGRSDGNAGTAPNAPWATFGKVMDEWHNAIGPGDTVHLERGSLWDISLGGDGWLIDQGGSAAGGYMTIRGDTYGTGAAPIVRRSLGSTQSTCFWLSVSLHNDEMIGIEKEHRLWPWWVSLRFPKHSSHLRNFIKLWKVLHASEQMIRPIT